MRNLELPKLQLLIPEENLANVFDAFFTTKPQGTGLGLPIARTIIQSYGGTIWAENRDHSSGALLQTGVGEGRRS